MKSTRIPLKRYAYPVLLLALVLSVGAAWLTERAFPALPAEADLPSAAAPSSMPSLPPGEETGEEPEAREEELAGIWVPYMALTASEHTREAFEAAYRKIVDSASEKGLNALFVHVRPFCDALYPSALFPWSHILTGEQGKDPGFDPLKFMVEYAHKKGLAFHAWINPLRVATVRTPEALSGDNLFSQLKEDCPYYFMETESGVWLDPAYPYIRSLVADGAAEIVKNYPVDGVHFDDYFYPEGADTADSEAYRLYVQTVEEPLPPEEWRRANISAMVQEVYEKVKAADPHAVFGISPQGNIANDEAMGADVRAWCAVEGYVDYLCPQLYYSFENPALGYEEALEEWLALPRREGLELYAGLALYKAGSDADQGTWQLSDDVIARQILAAREAQCAGVVLYSSEYLDLPRTESEVRRAMAVLAPEEKEKAAPR